MGCGGCELYPTSSKIIRNVANAVNQAQPNAGETAASVKHDFEWLIADAFQHEANTHPGHTNRVDTTNLWHLREGYRSIVAVRHGTAAADAAMDAMRKSVTCYAAFLHLNKGSNILDRQGIRPGKDRQRAVATGYAPRFEMPTRFPGRVLSMARMKDLLGQPREGAPWKERLPRMVFVSDMGDAFTRRSDFEFLQSDTMAAINSEHGRRHIWQWLTKRPATMAAFSREIGGFPENVCAMTTLTGPDEDSLRRLAELKEVSAHCRGLSIEPLWDRIPPEQFDLTGIDWVILGGESGAGRRLTRPFALEWTEEMMAHCRANGVAFFLKQLGRNPTRNGEILNLRNPHGGDWNEWEAHLRVREFPRQFHEYRSEAGEVESSNASGVVVVEEEREMEVAEA